MEPIIQWTIFLASTVAALLYMVRMRRKPVDPERDGAPLTSRQQPFVIVLLVLSPLIAGGIFYYGWIARFPKKARQANRWSIIVFALLVALYLLLGVH